MLTLLIAGVILGTFGATLYVVLLLKVMGRWERRRRHPHVSEESARRAEQGRKFHEG